MMNPHLRYYTCTFFSLIMYSMYSKTNTNIFPLHLYPMPSNTSCMVCHSLYNYNCIVRDSIYIDRSLLYRYTIYSHTLLEVYKLHRSLLPHHSICRRYIHLHFLPTATHRFAVFFLPLLLSLFSDHTVVASYQSASK